MQDFKAGDGIKYPPQNNAPETVYFSICWNIRYAHNFIRRITSAMGIIEQPRNLF